MSKVFLESQANNVNGHDFSLLLLPPFRYLTYAPLNLFILFWIVAILHPLTLCRSQQGLTLPLY